MKQEVFFRCHLHSTPVLKLPSRNAPRKGLERTSSRLRAYSAHSPSKKATKAAANATLDLAHLVPASKEDTVSQAANAIQLHLSQLKPSKSFKRRKQAKLAVEISLGDTSAASVAGLARDLLLQLGTDARQLCVAFGDIEAALVASDLLENEVLALAEPVESSALTKNLLLVSSAQAEHEETTLYNLLKQWRGAAVLWLELDRNSTTDIQSSTRKQFDTIYCFQPIAIRGLIRSVEGFIIKQPLDGKVNSAPWHVFKKGWGGFKCIARQERRPNTADIELAFYNASAVESPITQGIKAVRRLTARD